MNKENEEYPQLKFYIERVFKNPVELTSKSHYLNFEGECSDPKSCDWYTLNNRRVKEFNDFDETLNENGFLAMVSEVLFDTYEDSVTKKEDIESRKGFVEWCES